MVADPTFSAQIVSPSQRSYAGTDGQVHQAHYWSPRDASTAVAEMNRALTLATTPSFSPATPDLSVFMADALAGDVPLSASWGLPGASDVLPREVF
ncbi:hypothetical protein BRADI_3g37475v3 [Brachypodium distachyon]|uniref:Uncharacterized protein n=1 Tax=Brachypodium distachyon TaxID=15368 RepID=A0A0Q3M1Z6_BRADI|nr:hypothetical protein BRADI_3g37475v3 [Brachypodium distachyon]